MNGGNLFPVVLLLREVAESPQTHASASSHQGPPLGDLQEAMRIMAAWKGGSAPHSAWSSGPGS